MTLDAAGHATEQPADAETASAPDGCVAFCPCGSGLRHESCCALDAGALPNAAEPPPDTLQAIYAVRRRGIDEATELCLRLLTSTPTLLPALHLLFLIRRDQENRPAALALARRLVRLAPQDAGIALELGALFFDLRRWGEAEHQARHAVRLSSALCRAARAAGPRVPGAQGAGSGGVPCTARAEAVRAQAAAAPAPARPDTDPAGRPGGGADYGDRGARTWTGRSGDARPDGCCRGIQPQPRPGRRAAGTRGVTGRRRLGRLA